MSELEKLLSIFPKPGRVEWIGLSQRSRGDITSVEQVAVSVENGLDGDHHGGGRDRVRQVTLVQMEHLPVVASLAGVPEVDPAQLRRNIAVSGISLQALKNMRFRVGDVLFEGTGDCAPCSRMEKTIGRGGMNATRGHGGITARVLGGGTIRLGDAVIAVEAEELEPRELSSEPREHSSEA